VRALGLVCLPVGLVVTFAAGPPNQAPSPVDRAFAAFWAAPTQADAARRIDPILKSGVAFEDALTRVRHGREYRADVPRGLQFGRTRTFDSIEHQYAFVVPEPYEPTRPYPVRFYLHGAVNRPRPMALTRIRTNALPSSIEEISVFPIAWAGSPWWSATQADNFARILDRLKRTYNVDENQIYLTGASDGGTGVYFMAFTNTTPWASFVPLISDMMVLASPEVTGRTDMFPGNAVNKPFFVINGARDPMYPAHVVRLTVEHLNTLGGRAVFHAMPDSAHSTEWWPQAQGVFEAFVLEHPREPLPDRLTWETDRTDRFNRAHWLVIDSLGAVEGESTLSDGNLLRRGKEADFGLRINSRLDRGRRVSEIVPDSNAARIGLRVGDSFVEIDGTPVRDGADVARILGAWEIGGPVRLIVERAGRRVTLEGAFEPQLVELPPQPLFPRRRPSGRVDAVRRGNVVEASTQGVRVFTLLLSPSVFNFSQPVRVVANGRTVFDGMVEPSVATMLKWAAADDDRTMVFAAELRIDLTP
jgi:poly(3-hydroxybutyrate) depolymerase